MVACPKPWDRKGDSAAACHFLAAFANWASSQKEKMNQKSVFDVWLKKDLDWIQAVLNLMEGNARTWCLPALEWLRKDEECYDPPQFFSSIPVAPATTPPAVHAPAPVPTAQPIPTQPIAPPQPYIRTRPPSPIQVDPANVPLPTPSTDSDMSPPDQPMPASPRTHAFVEHLQGQIVHQATTGERSRTTTRATQDLRDALADMFGLPPLPIPQSPPARSPSPMAAISTSQSRRDESHHSPSAPSIPATRPHSPEPEAGPSKRPITWDLKDPAHPLH